VALEGRSRAKAARLDRLAKRPDASVAICEGEKSADAAARVFPNSVCITSPGGSLAASKADWSPLGGRRVLVWPDADEPGAKYAATVAGNLHGQVSEVLMIDAMALASMAPDGGKREPEKGWDAADAIAEWESFARRPMASPSRSSQERRGPLTVIGRLNRSGQCRCCLHPVSS